MMLPRNGYRQYGEASLLRLQQIRQYLKMDIPLKDIRDLVAQSDFDAGASPGRLTEPRCRRDKTSGTTHKGQIDKTIEHLEGKRKMKQSNILKLDGRKAAEI
jgi:DNA-binding transcriptional MerR regulator